MTLAYFTFLMIIFCYVKSNSPHSTHIDRLCKYITDDDDTLTWLLLQKKLSSVQLQLNWENKEKEQPTKGIALLVYKVHSLEYVHKLCEKKTREEIIMIFATFHTLFYVSSSELNGSG